MSKKLSDHEKEKGCWFTAVSHDKACCDKVKITCKEFPFWGYIDHRPDKGKDEEETHFHTHFIVRARGCRTIRQISATLDIPVNFCQVVRQKRSLMRYFIHLDNPEKIQYHEEDIFTNKIENFKEAWIDNSDNDIRRLYSDLSDLRIGKISSSQFLDRHYLEFQKMPFYQKIKIFEVIEKLCARTT